ncbi:MAG: hypothetical protein ACRDY0_07075, partial [Acidimicrobiales bacterium]
MRRRAAPVVLGLVLPAGVLVADPLGWSPFGPAKWLAVTVVVLAGAALALWGSRHRSGHGGVTATSVLVVAFVAWAAFAAAVGLGGPQGWWGTPQRRFGVVTWALCALAALAGRTLSDEGDARWVVGAAVATCGLLGTWATAEQLGWQPIALSGAGRLVGPL